MSREERTGKRDLTFSQWHRSLPDFCTAIDLDFLEYCQQCREPLALIEIAQGHYATPKPTTVLRMLAVKANIRAYLVMYDLNGTAPHGLASTMRLQRIFPDKSDIRTMDVEAVGKLIARLHTAHRCQ